MTPMNYMENLKNVYHVAYLYHRDKDNKPLVTECLFYDAEYNIISCGVAFCSRDDNPCKHTGRELAFYRAYNFHTTQDKPIIRRVEVCSILKKVGMVRYLIISEKWILNIPGYWYNYMSFYIDMASYRG
jgi:hypothetical protein